MNRRHEDFQSLTISKYLREEWKPQGKRIGWIDSEQFYLNPDASFALTQAEATRQGGVIEVSQKTLASRLKEETQLAKSTDNA